MNVNFEYYKIFYYVAKYGSFTKAARALGSTQPNVTRAMNCLEQHFIYPHQSRDTAHSGRRAALHPRFCCHGSIIYR